MASSSKALDQAIAIDCKEVVITWGSWLENQRRLSFITRIAYLHDIEVFLAFLSKTDKIDFRGLPQLRSNSPHFIDFFH